MATDTKTKGKDEDVKGKAQKRGEILQPTRTSRPREGQ